MLNYWVKEIGAQAASLRSLKKKGDFICRVVAVRVVSYGQDMTINRNRFLADYGDGTSIGVLGGNLICGHSKMKIELI